MLLNMGIKPLYKEPKIIRAARGWFIALYYLKPDGSGFKRFEFSGGINYIKDLKERERQIQQMLKYLKKELNRGFNPFFPDLEERYKAAIEEKKESISKSERKSDRWTLEQGLKVYMDHCREKNLSENTLKTYGTYIENFQTWLSENNLLSMTCDLVDENLVRRFLNDSDGVWLPRTYNNHLAFLRRFFDKLAKLEKKEHPTVKYVADLSDIEDKLTRAEKNRYYSANVAERVKKELDKDDAMYNYVKWIFYSCMRPREIRHLQIKHIDLGVRQIKVPAPTAKTGDRFVPICDELLEMILEMDLDRFPLDYYVFGDKGKIGEEIASRDYYAKRYKPIKERLGLDDKYTLYGWKHTRVVNLVLAGFTDNEIMTLTGHSDYKSYQAYKRDLMVDSSKMKGKTISI